LRYLKSKILESDTRQCFTTLYNWHISIVATVNALQDIDKKQRVRRIVCYCSIAIEFLADEFYAENEGVVKKISDTELVIEEKTYVLPSDAEVLVSPDDVVTFGSPIYKADVINNVFYVDICRIGLLLFLIVLCVFIRFARQHNFEEITIE
jgi:hypothetical protein